MKKLANKFTKIAINCLAAIATLLVAFLGVFSSPLMNVAKVMAAGGSSSSALTLAKLKNKVKLGNNIVIPKGEAGSATVNAIIKDPKGATLFDSTKVSEYESAVDGGVTTYTIKDSAGTVKAKVSDDGTNYSLKAERVGTYKVSYYVQEVGAFRALKTQEFKIQVTGEKATLSFEENSEYIIPSVINSGNTVVLPNPIVKDSAGNDVAEADVLNRLTVKIKNATTGDEYTSANASDSYFIKKVNNHYSFAPSGDESCSYIISYTYKDNLTELDTTYPPFEVKYEKDFKASNIKLGYKFTQVDGGLSSIPSSFELGTDVILPIASFYDENDSDFEVKGHTVVNVIFTPNEASKTKYSSLLETGKDYVVVAKNTNKFKPMYPSTEGTYTITYDLSSYYTMDANSKKTETEEKKADIHLIYKVTDAKDSTAPTTYVVKDYSEEDIDDDYEIVDVSYLLPTKVKTGTTIKFPAIYAEDNVSSFAEMKDSFHRVIVPEKDTNITLENQTKTGSTEKYKFNETASYTFEKAGTYTIRYEATDKANKYNYTGTTFTIVVEDDFEDGAKPRITMSSVPASVKAGDTVEIKKPTVIDYKSDKPSETEIDDKNLEIYNLYYQTSSIVSEDALKAELKEFRKNGQSANLKLLEEKENDSTTLSFTAESDVTVVCVAFDDSFYEDETTDVGMSYEKRSIKVLNIETDNVAPSIETSDANYISGFDADKLKQDEEIIIPSLKTTDNENTQYLEGFVDVYDKNGNSISVVGAKYFVDGNKMTISDAKFVATKSGEYTIVYTLKDIGDNYVIKSYVVEIADTKAPTIELDGTISSAEIGQSLRIPSVIVRDDNEIINPTKLEILFGDNCPSYTFNKGTNEFTAREVGTFKYKYIAYDAAGNKAESPFYSFEAKDTQKPVITTEYDLNTIKTFKLEKVEGSNDYKAIELPDYVAEDVLNGIRESKVIVKSPKNKELKVTYNAEKGVYTFVPTVDGAYTVIYSATDNANNLTELTYIIKIGDTTAPSVEFDSGMNFGKKSDVKVSKTLSIDLSKISISDKGETKTAKELADEYTNGTLKMFTITVTGPDGQTLTANEGTASAIKEYTLSSAGKYTITYIARDKAGNEKIVKEYVTAYADENKSVISTETWSIVLIVISLAILAGVVIYFVKTRDKKTNKGTPVKLSDKKDDKKDDKKQD